MKKRRARSNVPGPAATFDGRSLTLHPIGKLPERGFVVLDQPQHAPPEHKAEFVTLLRLVYDTAALLGSVSRCAHSLFNFYYGIARLGQLP